MPSSIDMSARPRVGSLVPEIHADQAVGSGMDGRPGAVREVLLPAGYTLSGPVPVAPTELTVRTVPATRDADGLPVWVHIASGEVDAVTRRRLRSELPELLELLAGFRDVPLAAVVAAGDPGDPRPYLVTFRTGPRLGLSAGPAPVPLVRRAVHDAADALAALHAAGHAHGGIAPDALFRDGESVRIDPPLPAALADLVAAAGGRGTEPPEVLQGGQPSPAADVFALASTAWTLLAGRVPYNGPDHEVRLARLGGTPLPVLPRTDVGEAIESAIQAATTADPDRRPDLAALVQAFELSGPAPLRAPERLDTQLPSHPLDEARDAAERGQPLGSRYLLDRLVGRGATGHVWRAHTRDSDITVAVKLLRSDLAEDPDVVTRFMRERTTLTGVAHPNLVRVRDLVAEGDVLAVVMDYVDGPDLRGFAGGRPMPLREAAALLSQTASALAAVHAAGIVHRDLKPENVLVETHGANVRARLTDFGLARAAESSTVTRLSQLVGTPAYLAPEIVAGRPAGPAADVYALGVTGYELLCGHRPFRHDATAALLRAQLDEEPPRPDGVPDNAWAVLQRCLDKNPDRRPDADTLARCWLQLADHPDAPALIPERREEELPPTGDGAALTEMARRPVPEGAPAEHEARRSRKWWWVAGAAVIVVGFAGGLLFGLGGNDHPKATSTKTAVPKLVRYPVAATVTTSGKGLAVVTARGLSEYKPGTLTVVVRVDGAKRTPLDVSQPFGPGHPTGTILLDPPPESLCVLVFAYPDPAPSTKPAPEQQSCLP